MNKIIFITGSPGAGKTTIGRRVAEQFPKSIHIDLDDLRGSVMSGAITPGEWSDEATKQFQLARTTAAYMAKLYRANGFDVIIDDVCVPEFFAEQWAELFQHEGVNKVLLLPTPAALTARMRKRNGPFEEFFITQAIPWLYSYLEPMDKSGWIVIDSSGLSIEQTVATVLQQIGE